MADENHSTGSSLLKHFAVNRQDRNTDVGQCMSAREN